MKLKICSAILAILVNTAAYSQIIMTENFNNAVNFKLSTGSLFIQGDDYLQITSNSIDGYDFTNFSGNYLTGQDLDGVNGVTFPVTVTWENLNITGKTTFQFSGQFAATTGTIDNADYLLVQYSTDEGNNWETILELNKTNLDGNSNGNFSYNGHEINQSATTLSETFNTSGDTMYLRLSIKVNSGDEVFAVDSFQVSAIPETSTYAAILGGLALGAYSIRRRNRLKTTA